MEPVPSLKDGQRPANFAEESSQDRTAAPDKGVAHTQTGFGGFNPRQRAILEEAPTTCRGILERAYGGKSKAAALKAFCLHCVGYIRADVRDCTSYGCPLHPYRPYQQDDEAEDAE